MKKRNWILSMGAGLCLVAALSLVFCTGDKATASGTKVTPKGSAVVVLPNLGKQPTDPHYGTGSPEWPMAFALSGGQGGRLLYLDHNGRMQPGPSGL